MHGGAGGESAGLDMHDRATKYKRCYPQGVRAASETKQSFANFAGKGRKPGLIHFGLAKEFIDASQQLTGLYKPSTPGISEANGVAEREVQDVRQGTTCSLLQAGLFPEHWPVASGYFCTADNISEHPNGNVPYIGFTGEEFKGIQMPFGARCFFYPTEKTS